MSWEWGVGTGFGRKHEAWWGVEPFGALQAGKTQTPQRKAGVSNTRLLRCSGETGVNVMGKGGL